MDTYEFQFPGGSAVITTTTGGTRDAPDFCVRVPDDDKFAGDAASIFAAEILKLAGRVEELETALAAAGEERENMENRLSARIAELEAEVERRAAENVAMQDQSRSIINAILEISKLFKGSPEARIAALERENIRLKETLDSMRRVAEGLAARGNPGTMAAFRAYLDGFPSNAQDSDLCRWPGCRTIALCQSGNFGNQLVCAEHFAITNGEGILGHIEDQIASQK